MNLFGLKIILSVLFLSGFNKLVCHQGIYNDFVSMPRAKGFSGNDSAQLKRFFSLANSACGPLVALKITQQKESTFDPSLKEVVLPSKIEPGRAVFFVADYRLFVDFLYKHVYEKINLAKLEIPCLIFFQAGKLILPIESCDFLNHEPIFERIFYRLNSLEQTIIPQKFIGF